MESVRELLEQAAEKFGDKTYLFYHDEQISFIEMDARANRVANAFLAEGIKKGDRVAVMMLNRPEYLYLWYGLNKIGAGMVPINSEFTAYETEYLINHSESKMLAIDAGHYQILKDIRPNCPGLGKALLLDMDQAGENEELFPDFWSKQPVPLKKVDIKVNDESAILYTSGTTGRPKGCIVDQLYYLHIGRIYVDQHLITAEDRILTPLPLFHMNAQSLTAMGGLISGAGVIFIDRFHPATWWEAIRKYQVTFFHYLGVIPAILYSMPETAQDALPKKVYGIGAGVPRDIHAAFEKRFNVELLELYGSTEGGGGGAYMTGRKLKDRKVGTASFGKPVPGVEGKIVDDADKEVPHGEIGELVTWATDPANPRKGYMLGYLKDPEATEKVWRSGWFHTGDFCRQDESGYCYFIDRKKDIIRRSGENISASEVESVVRLHPSIADVAAIPVPDTKRIEEVKIYVVKKPGAEVTPEEIIRWSEDRLAYFKIPRYVEFRDSLPKTSTEKIKKNELKTERPDLIEGAWDRTKNMKLKRELEKDKKKQSA